MGSHHRPARRGGIALEHRPIIASDGGAHGWTNYTSRVVWINSRCDEAEQLRIAAHELWGHIRGDHETGDISTTKAEVEADSVAFIVLAALGLRIDSSPVDYVADWSKGDLDLIRQAAETRVANAVLAEIDNLGAVHDAE